MNIDPKVLEEFPRKTALEFIDQKPPGLEKYIRGIGFMFRNETGIVERQGIIVHSLMSRSDLVSALRKLADAFETREGVRVGEEPLRGHEINLSDTPEIILGLMEISARIEPDFRPALKP